MSGPDSILDHVWAIRETMRRLGLAVPPPTDHVRRQVGRLRPPRKLLPIRSQTQRPPSHPTPPSPMPLERKALVVTHTPSQDTASADALTDLLNDDWRIVSTTAMGGTGGATAPAQFAALVILEREETKSVAGFSAR